MAEIQSVRGDKDKRAKGAIDKISRTGRSAVAGSIGTHLSGGLRRSSSESCAAAPGRRSRQGSGERGGRSERGGCGRSVRPKPPGRVRPGRPAPIGEPGPTGGPGLVGEFERFLIKF
jgi:hypothetical protein